MTIRRRNYGDNHAYYDVTTDPDTDEDVEVKIPGVTTLLSNGIPKSGLTNWAAEQAAQYAITNWAELGELPLLKRAKEIQYAWKGERDRAANRGRKIHQLAEQLIAGEKVDIPDGLEGHVESCVKFLDEFDVVEVISEATCVNRTHGYAGTLDLVCDMLGKRWLLDWKTGRNVYAESTLQLAAYAHAEHYLDGRVEKPMTELGIQAGGIVHLRADGYDLYPANIGELPYKVFRHVAYLAGWVAWDKVNGTRLDAFLGRAMQPTAVAS